MRRAEIIPAMDILNGKCVRLEMGNYSNKRVYDIDPVEQALKFENMGLKTLHMVDLEGAKGKEPINLKTLEKIASKTHLTIQFGGGIKSLSSADSAFSAGAKRVIAGSISVKNPEELVVIIERFGSDKIVLGVDIYNEAIAINGWQERVNVDINSLVSYYANKGVYGLICTDISKDGMMKGPSIELYINLIRDFPELTIIASGGVSSVKDLETLSLTNVNGVIVGKAFYEGVLTEKEIVKWLQNE